MTPREEIMARVRRHQPAPVALPELPAFALGDAAARAPFDDFAAALQRMGGRVAEAPADGDLAAVLRALYPDARVLASATPEVAGHRDLATLQRPADLDDVDLGIVRAAFGVAETGSVLLTEAHLQVEALGFLAQHLVVLLDPANIVPTLHHAYQHPAFTRARYVIFMTGPSATADIEGVLIHGAQGVRSLTVLPVPSPVAT
jgi:L-lactate dehydrogenase complex protein LldG